MIKVRNWKYPTWAIANLPLFWIIIANLPLANLQKYHHDYHSNGIVTKYLELAENLQMPTEPENLLCQGIVAIYLSGIQPGD